MKIWSKFVLSIVLVVLLIGVVAGNDIGGNTDATQPQQKNEMQPKIPIQNQTFIILIQSTVKLPVNNTTTLIMSIENVSQSIQILNGDPEIVNVSISNNEEFNIIQVPNGWRLTPNPNGVSGKLNITLKGLKVGESKISFKLGDEKVDPPVVVNVTSPMKTQEEVGPDWISFGFGVGAGAAIGVAVAFVALPRMQKETDEFFRRKEPKIKEKTIVIKVVDAENDKPIPSAKVILKYNGERRPAHTDNRGICKVNIPEFWDKIKVKIEKDGYKTFTGTLSVIEKKQQYTARLKPEKFELNVRVVDDNENLVSGAKVTVNGETKTTKDGIATFILRKGNYSIKVEKENYYSSEKPIELNKNLEETIKISKEIGTIKFEIKDVFDGLEGIKIYVNGYKVTTDPEGYAELTLPVGTYDIRITDPRGIYEKLTDSIEVKKGTNSFKKILKEPSDEIRTYHFIKTEKAYNELNKVVETQIPAEKYDNEIPRYLKALGECYLRLNSKLKDNIGILRRSSEIKSVIELFREVDSLSSNIINKIIEILTSKEGMYILYDIKRFRGNVLEMPIDLNEKMENIIDRALEFEKKGIIREEVERLSLEVDREIMEVMREGVNGYFFSALYQVYKSLDVKHAYIVPYLLLSTIKLMLQSHSIKNKLKGLAG